VVAPYATALAAMIDPRAALANFARLEQAEHAEPTGSTSARLHPLETAGGDPRGRGPRLHGASPGDDSHLSGERVERRLDRKRFHSHPMVQAAELLLQERTPRAVAITRPRAEESRSLRTCGPPSSHPAALRLAA